MPVVVLLPMVVRWPTALGILALHLLALALVTAWCPEAYMDETLHVPQALKYCDGDWWHWDPKITTLPGTYILSRAVLAPAIWMLGPEACTVESLRCVNALFLGPLASLFGAGLLWEIHGGAPAVPKAALQLRAARLAVMPLHFFFCALYYTDAASTCLVMLTYWLHRRGLWRLSALAGAVAVVARQTNVVWLWAAAVHHFSGLGGPRAWAERLFKALQSGALVPHALVGAAFAFFVVWNRGIVVGDRAHHAAVLHFAMLPYFAAFALFFAGPAAWLELLRRLTRARPRALLEGLVAAAAFAVMAEFGSYAHPFLLADNRHYTFYLWKNLLRQRAVRVVALPAALGLATVALRSPGQRSLAACSGREAALWMLCCALVLVPTPLLELRYFIVPTMLMLLHQPIGSARDEALAVLVSVCINMVTMGVFLFRPFTSAAWGPEPQRFMW